jgi:hypothetical protein
MLRSLVSCSYVINVLSIKGSAMNARGLGGTCWCGDWGVGGLDGSKTEVRLSTQGDRRRGGLPGNGSDELQPPGASIFRHSQCGPQRAVIFTSDCITGTCTCFGRPGLESRGLG